MESKTNDVDSKSYERNLEKEANLCVKSSSIPEGQSKVLTLLQMKESVFKEKLTLLNNDKELDATSKLKEKLSVMQSYLEEVEKNNEVLTTIILELEKEAHDRVKQMENQLKSSAKTAMEAVISIHECEKEMRRLVEERVSTESLVDCMGQLLTSLKNENNYLRDQNYNLNHDLQALLQIIQHARTTGHWEMDCIALCEVSPEQIFGPIQSLSTLTSDPVNGQAMDPKNVPN